MWNTLATKEFIASALKKHFLFASMKDSELSGVVAAMRKRTFSTGEAVITQGEDGNHFYVVEKGHLVIRANGVEVAEADPGDCFGELALLHNCPRAATVEAASDIVLYELDRTSFRTALASASSKKEGNIVEALSRIELLDGLTGDDLNLLASEVNELEYQPGQVIIKKGDIGDCLYLIADGEVVCKDIGADKAEIQLSSGMYFGEMALRTKSPRLATVVAQTRCTLFALDRHSFKTVLGSLDDLLEENFRLHVIEAAHEFDSMTHIERKHIARSLVLQDYEEFQILVRKGLPVECIFMVSDGELVVTDKEITIEQSQGDDWFGSWFDSLDQGDYRWISKGDHFGALDNTGSPISVVAMGNVQCLTIEKSTLDSLRLKGAIASGDGSRSSQATSIKTFSMNDFDMIEKDIGKGSFSTVHLLREREQADGEVEDVHVVDGDIDLDVLHVNTLRL